MKIKINNTLLFKRNGDGRTAQHMTMMISCNYFSNISFSLFSVSRLKYFFLFIFLRSAKKKLNLEEEEIFYLVNGLKISEKEAKRIVLSKEIKGKLID